MSVFIATIFFGILGLFMGSFAGATLWRLRARQLHEDESAGEKIPSHDKKEVQKLQKTSLLKDRSVCLHCGHQLQWYDLIPILSWVSTGGKCRYCHKSIGGFEPAIELTVGVFFAVTFLFWPHPLTTPLEVAQFVLWLAAGVGLSLLVFYDAKWFLLPNRVVFPLIGIGALYSLLTLVQSQFAVTQLMSIFYSGLTLSGLYYVIYVVSKHQWIGFGDVKLGLVLALLLADWQLAIIALFLANLIGTLLVLPLMLGGKIKRQARIPFGPLLISGWFIAGLFGERIITWYMGLALGSY